MVAGCHIQPEQFFNLIFGYYAAWLEYWSNLNATAATNRHEFTEVPPGELWVLTAMAAYNANTAPSYITFDVYDGTNLYGFRRAKSPGVDVAVEWNGHVYIPAGYRARVNFFGCTLNDDIFAQVLGYKMKVSQ